jgi:selenocysteine-specific elongation factor
MPAPSTLEYMETAGLVVRTRAGVVFDAAVFATMRERALAHASTSGQVTLAQVRDMFGTSRKYAQAFLEHLDDLKLTRRVGDARVLRES